MRPDTERRRERGTGSTGERGVEAAVTAASPEDLLVAWQAALKTQQDQEMRSESWSQAREVSELIRVEYLASK